MNRLTQTSTTYSFVSGKTFTVGYGYDAASNRTSMTDPQNAATAYVYDTLNRLTTLTYPTHTNFTFSYDALGRRTKLVRPNGVTTNYQYDTISDLLSALHQITSKSGTTTLDGATYQYDVAGNRTSKTDNRTNLTSNFSYDPTYQLTQVTQGSTTESYSYDLAGNRLSSLGVSSYAYNPSNELTSKGAATYTYDNNGNVLTKTDSTGTTTYTWDFENRLTSVAMPGSGGTVTFKYDPVGRRIQKSSILGTTNYLYDGADSLEEIDNSGSVLARYTRSLGIDQPLAELRSGVTSYYEADGLGSVTSLSNSSGTTVNTYTYDSFGNLPASTGTLSNPLRYTAREFDSETGLYFYRARYYDSTAGRFLNEDPTRFWAGTNFYGYVRNDATGFVDPSGLLDVFIWNGTGSLGEGNWGHAAILLDDGTYISWWPGRADDPNNPNLIVQEGGKHFARNARDPSYADDISQGTEGEGHGPDEDIYINSLDEAAIRKWWNQFQKNKLWDSFNRNCSNAVMDALKAGGAGKFVKPQKNLIGPTSPADVLKYAQQLQIYNHNAWNSGIDLVF